MAIRLPRLLWIGSLIAMLSVSAATGADPDDDDLEDRAAPPVQQPRLAELNVFAFVFGYGSNAVAVRQRLEAAVRQKINSADLIYDLTDSQIQKLELAGRGDIERLLDRLDGIGTRFRLAGNDRDKIDVLQKEAELLRTSVTTELSDDGSLLYKSMRKILTTEQNARMQTLREIERLGGRVITDSRGSEAILEIQLSGVAIGDRDLARLKILIKLQGLDLGSTQITDSGLAHLERFTNLKSLNLAGTRVTDAGLAHLAGLPNLERLVLFGTPVTAAGAASLRGLTNLTELDLCGTQITDSGLAHLTRLSELQAFNLQRTPVTDAGLVHLKDLTNLRWLDLSRTQVTDAGVVHLKELKNLRWLNVSGTQITDAGLANLKKALPTANLWKRPIAEPD